MIILSLHDLVYAAKKKKKLLLIHILLGSLFLFSYSLSKPLTYRATGRFVNMTPSSSSPLEILMQPKQKPSALIYYYPSLRKTVETLALHGIILPPHKEANRRLLNKLKSEFFYLQPTIRSPECNAYDAFLVPPSKETLILKELSYHSPFRETFRILFTGEDSYVVLKKRKKLGEGKIGMPFFWGEGHFFCLALNDKVDKGESFTLKILPIDQVLYRLSKKLRVQKDPLSTDSYLVKYEDLNPYQTALVINTFITSYQEYIAHIGKAKIKAKQDYLALRKEAAKEVIFKTMKPAESQGESFLPFEAESQWIEQQYRQNRAKLMALIKEMEALYELLYGHFLPYPEIVKARKQEINPPDLLLERIAKQISAIDQLDVKMIHCDQSLSQLEKATPCALLTTPALQLIFSKIEKLERSLEDRENFSKGEQKQLQDQLLLERTLLQQEYLKIRNNILIEKQAVQEKIALLQHQLLHALCENYLLLEQERIELQKRALSLPEKWKEEVVLSSTTQIENAIVKGLSEAIETSNLQEAMAPFHVIALDWAAIPSLVKPPRLLLHFLVGGFMGGLFTLLTIFFIEARKGPSCHKENLKQYGYRYLGKGSPFSLKKKDQKIFSQLFSEIEGAGSILFCGNSELYQYLIKKVGEEKIVFCKESLAHPFFKQWQANADKIIIELKEERMADLEEVDAQKALFFTLERKRKAMPGLKIHELLHALIQRFTVHR